MTHATNSEHGIFQVIGTSKLRFFARVMLFGILMKVIAVTALYVSTQLSVPHASATMSDVSQWGVVAFATIAVIVAPIAETIAMQVIPLELCRRIRVPRVLSILISATIFGFYHSREDYAKVIATFCTGSLLAFIYLRYRGDNPSPRMRPFKAVEGESAYKTAILRDVHWFMSECPPSGFIHAASVHAFSNLIAVTAVLFSVYG